MNASGDPRPQAVRHAEAGAVAWRTAVHAQRAASADHADFYALAGELVDTLESLQTLAGVLGRQVEGYGDGRSIYDDTRVVDPRDRLADAVLALAETRKDINRAVQRANRFWSAIGHIGVEVTP